MDVCEQCGSIPSHGLLEVAGKAICATDCPGVDSGKYCDHQCVGALIRNEHGEILLFHRGTYPFVIAGPAGHCDGDPADLAVIKEVEEEVGLQVTHTALLTHFWHGARCRRRYAGTHGHYWQFFECQVRGELRASARETKAGTLRWYRRDEVASLLRQSTVPQLYGEPETALDPPWLRCISEMMMNGLW